MDLMLIMKIGGVLAILAFIILAIYLVISISSFIKLTRDVNASLEILTTEVSHSLKIITSDINELKTKVVESLEIVDKTAVQISQSTQKIEKEANEVLNIFTPFRALANLAFDRIAAPVNKFTLLFSASYRAINAFVNGLANKL